MAIDDTLGLQLELVELEMRRVSHRAQREQVATLHRCQEQLLRTPRVTGTVEVCRRCGPEHRKTGARHPRVSRRTSRQMRFIAVWQWFHDGTLADATTGNVFSSSTIAIIEWKRADIHGTLVIQWRREQRACRARGCIAGAIGRSRTAEGAEYSAGPVGFIGWSLTREAILWPQPSVQRDRSGITIAQC